MFILFFKTEVSINYAFIFSPLCQTFLFSWHNSMRQLDSGQSEEAGKHEGSGIDRETLTTAHIKLASYDGINMKMLHMLLEMKRKRCFHKQTPARNNLKPGLISKLLIFLISGFPAILEFKDTVMVCFRICVTLLIHYYVEINHIQNNSRWWKQWWWEQE